MTSCFVLVAECARLSRAHKLCCKNHYDAIFTQFKGKKWARNNVLITTWLMCGNYNLGFHSNVVNLIDHTVRCKGCKIGENYKYPTSSFFSHFSMQRSNLIVQFYRHCGGVM